MENQKTMSTHKKVDMLKVRKACFILAIIAVAAFALYFICTLACLKYRLETETTETSLSSTTYFFTKAGEVLTQIGGCLLIASGLGLGISLLIQAIAGLKRSKDTKFVSANAVNIILAVGALAAAMIMFAHLSMSDEYTAGEAYKTYILGWDRYAQLICVCAAVVAAIAIFSIFANRGDFNKSLNKSALAYAAVALVIFIIYIAYMMIAKKTIDAENPTEKQIYAWHRAWLAAAVLAVMAGALACTLIISLSLYLVNNIKSLNVAHLVTLCVIIVGIIVLFGLFVNQIKCPYPLDFDASESKEEAWEKATEKFMTNYVEDWKNHCIYGGLMTGFSIGAGVSSLLCMLKRSKAVKAA